MDIEAVRKRFEKARHMTMGGVYSQEMIFAILTNAIALKGTP